MTKRSVVIQVRVPEFERQEWMKTATAEGKSLSDWIRGRCRDAVNARRTPKVESVPLKHPIDETATVEDIPSREATNKVQQFMASRDKWCERCRRLGTPACEVCRKAAGLS